MRTSFQTLVNALLAGIFIGIAGTVYLAVKDPVVGAVLFGFGLLTILCYGFKLYTGAIGYLANQGKKTLPYCRTLVLIWCGNFGGAWLVGNLVRQSRSFVRIDARVAAMCAEKLSDAPLSLLILSFFCGILMYVAVETYRREELAPIFRFFTVFLCVSIFILSGFEHCIADMFYFSAADVWSVRTLHVTLLLTLGNSLGGMLLPVMDKIRK